MSAADDERWMGRALELARRGVGETNPNPMVGCVIVRGGRVVGEGWHRRAGGPHAEVEALRKAGSAARGATLYVTLEPCAHQGRTPPCVDAVLEAGPRKVVAAMRDPNPAVDGRGLSALRRAGIATRVGVRQDEARVLNERFVVAAGLPRPFVLLKAAITLDGRVATASGESKWITSAAQRRRARGLRRLHDGVAVGVGTVLADDPLLLPVPGTRRPFHRVIFDSRLRLPPKSRLATSVSRSPVWVVTVPGADPRARAALEARGVHVVETEGADERVEVAPALSTLRRAGLWSLMVEGGSELLGAFLHSRAFDQVALFRAPLLLGGRGARPAFGGPDVPRLADAVRLTPQSPLVARGSSARSPAAPDDGSYELWYPAR